ncbi:MAG: smalltalk protein [Bacteroidaceae bacterium]|nr:smalltalk protein [Bacteroidaceae bacterium]
MKINWSTIKKIIQIIITILTSVVGTLCVQSCMHS